MQVRAGRARLPENYYPEAQHSYMQGSVIVTTPDPTLEHGSQIEMPFSAYLISIEIDADSHHYQNHFRVEMIGADGIPYRTLIQHVFDSGQKILPMVIPEHVPAGHKIRLSVVNDVGVTQIVAWHGNFIY